MTDAFAHAWRAAQDSLESGIAPWVQAFFGHLPAGGSERVTAALRGGKRVRGGLLLLTHRALGGRPVDALPLAVAVECIQAASLIHDDFIDGDTARRGRPALWVEAGPRRAVLLGDLLFATAIHRLAERDVRAGAIAARTIATIASGAYHEPVDGIDTGAMPYAELARRKTAALFGAAAELAAVDTGAAPGVCDAAAALGNAIGQAYQIADDLVDVRSLVHRPPVLAPLFRHFLPDTAAPDADPDHLRASLPLIERRMRRAIRACQERAADALRQFPQSARNAGLQGAPRALVAMMLQEGLTPARSRSPSRAE